MTRKFGCRAMSLLLAFITLLSTVSVSFADPNVTGKGDQGNGGGGTTFGTMHGSGDNFAFRIYIFD